jgi:hypothetical protein
VERLALSRHFAEILLEMIGGAVAVALLVSALVYAGSTRRSRRYRPGRPFTFMPVWFVSAPERQARTGSVGSGRSQGARRSLTSGASGGTSAARRGETGGASDRW